MKHSLSAAAAGLLALGLAPAHAQGGAPASGVTIYGVADAGVEWSNNGAGSSRRLVSGGALGSRLGFRGVEDLGGGLSAVFRLEQGINLDDGTLGQGGRAFGREASVGLASTAWGTVTAGRLPTPYYVAQSGVDAFSLMGSGGHLAITRSTDATRQLLPLAVSARFDNAVGYVTPRLGPLTFRAMAAAGENQPTIGRAYSASATYRNGPVDAVLAWARQQGADNANGRIDAVVAGGSYDFGAAKIFAGYTAEKNSCGTCTGALARAQGVTGAAASEFRLINLGARVPFGAFTAIVQAVRISDRSAYAAATGQRDATWLAIGGEYTLSKRTMAYASLGAVGNQNGSRYALGSGSAQQPAGLGGAGDHRSTTLTLGMRHAF